MKYLLGIVTALFILASASSAFASTKGDIQANFGDGVAAYSLQNYEKAAQIWQNLAENGSGDAAFRLAQLYDLGLGVEYNPDNVVLWLSLAVEYGHVPSQYMLAEIYASGRGVDVNSDKAFELYALAADNNHPKAMYQLASIYYLGESTPKNNLLAAYWFSKASQNLTSKVQRDIAKDLYDSIMSKLSDAEKLDLLRRLAFQ